MLSHIIFMCYRIVVWQFIDCIWSSYDMYVWDFCSRRNQLKNEWCRNSCSGSLLLFPCRITSGLAASLLLWPTITEQLHLTRNVHRNPNTDCPTAKTGLLGGGAFVSLDSALFWLVALMLADNAREDHFDEDLPSTLKTTTIWWFILTRANQMKWKKNLLCVTHVISMIFSKDFLIHVNVIEIIFLAFNCLFPGMYSRSLFSFLCISLSQVSII